MIVYLLLVLGVLIGVVVSIVLVLGGLWNTPAYRKGTIGPLTASIVGFAWIVLSIIIGFNVLHSGAVGLREKHTAMCYRVLPYVRKESRPAVMCKYQPYEAISQWRRRYPAVRLILEQEG